LVGVQRVRLDPGDGRDAVHRDGQLGVARGVERSQSSGLEPERTYAPSLRDTMGVHELEPHVRAVLDEKRIQEHLLKKDLLS
jgi:hypothetical protein